MAHFPARFQRLAEVLSDVSHFLLRWGLVGTWVELFVFNAEMCQDHARTYKSHVHAPTPPPTAVLLLFTLSRDQAMATAGGLAMRAEVLHETLRLYVDIAQRHMRGHATLWILLPSPPADVGAPAEGDFFTYRLHARQMEIHEVRVNDEVASYVYPHPVDLLRDFVPCQREEIGDKEEGQKIAETSLDYDALDMHYRCELIASQEGELGLQLPKRQTWAPSHRDDVDILPQVVLNAQAAALRIAKVDITYSLDHPVAGLRFESQPAHAYSVRCPSVLHDVDGPRCWFPCADRTTDVFTLDMIISVPCSISGVGEANGAEGGERGNTGSLGHSDQKGATDGVVDGFRTDLCGDCTHPNTARNARPPIVLVGGGELVGKRMTSGEEATEWHYAIETPITASAVSLVVGHFGRYVDREVPWVSHHYLLRGAATGSSVAERDCGGGSEATPASSPPPPPRSWVAHSVEGMGPALSFLADFFHLAPGGAAAAPPAKNGTILGPRPASSSPCLTHRTVFVRGLPDTAIAFHGLSLHRAGDLHPCRVFDSSMALHLGMAEAFFASWLLPRLRPRFSRDRWIFHGVLGYLLLLYVRRRLGEHEYRCRLLRLMDAVIALEREGQSMPLLPPDSLLLAREMYSPANLELVRVKPPIIMHMIEQRVGRKPLRDVLRSVACPTLAAASSTGEPSDGIDPDAAAARDMDDPDPSASSPKHAAGMTPVSAGTVRPQALKTLGFLRLCLKTSSRGDFIKNLRECWLEGRGPAYFSVFHAFDRRAPKPELTITVRQTVPPWGRLFTGPLRVRIMEDGGPYDYDRDISEAEHVFTFKLHSKVRKVGGSRQRKQQISANLSEKDPGPEAGSKAKKAAKAGAHDDGDMPSGIDGGDPATDAPKPKKRRKKANAAAEASSAEQEQALAGGSATPSVSETLTGGVRGSRQEDDDYTLSRREHYCPVVWLRLDPDLQWIAEWEWENLPEYIFLEQLHRDPDAAAQCLALRALTSYPKATQDTTALVGSVQSGTTLRPSLAAQAMSDCVRGKQGPGWVEPSLNVRMEAARALAAWQSNHAPGSMITADSGWRGLDFLFCAYRERYFDATSRVPLPADFTDEAEYQLQKALLYAISLVRGKDRYSPRMVWEFLRSVLEGHDNSRNPFDDSAFLRTVLSAVANLRVNSSQERSGTSLVENLHPQVMRHLIWHQEVGSHDHAVEAAALRALWNLELVRGGSQAKAVEFLQYVKSIPDQVLSKKALSDPSSLVPLRLAALEAVVRLQIQEAKHFDTDSSAAEAAGAGIEGPRKALHWVLTILRHEKACGSIIFCYKALQVLFEALRHPLDYRSDALNFNAPLALAPTHFLDHLATNGQAYDELDAAVASNASLKSKENPYLSSLRSTEFVGPHEDVRKEMWHFITTESWYSQPLRGMALWLFQAIWGYRPLEESKLHDKEDPVGTNEAGSSELKEFIGLEDVYMELLGLRADGVFSLRSTLFDDHDWRVWRDRRARRLSAQPGGGRKENVAGNKSLSLEDLSDTERSERKMCLESRKAIMKSNSKVRLKVSIAKASV